MGTTNILSRLFTQSSLSSFVDVNDAPTYRKIVRRYSIPTEGQRSNSDVLSDIYCILEKDYRNEYYYKNTLLNKLLINAHRINTTTALTEVPLSKSIADFIMINGKAVVYEIKTDLDSLDRLDTQIEDYYKVFDHVCVVGGEKKKEELLSKFDNTPVGVYILSSRNTISRQKEPDLYIDKLDVSEMFRVLRKAEYEELVVQLEGELPKTSPVKHYEECKSLVCSHTVEEVYPLLLRILKKRNKIEQIDYDTIPTALRFLVYFSKFRDADLKQLTVFLEKAYEEGGC